MSDCKGCLDHSTCVFIAQGYCAITECPCRICIIKVTCTEICDDLKRHYNKIFMGSN
jgi:hypothetical protein